jgi:signal transduction histidine kinase
MENPPALGLQPLSHAVACCDTDLRLTFADPGFLRVLELPAHPLDCPVSEWQVAAAAAAWVGALHHVRNTGEGTGLEFSSASAGTTAHWELEVWPQRQHGQVTGLLSVLRNVQDRRQTEAELARATDHLENFLYTAAHDLRSPVSNMQVLLNLFLEHPQEAGKHALLEHFSQSMQQLVGTIDGLVEVLEVQSTFRVQAQEIELATLFAEVLRELEAEATAAGAEIISNFEALPRLRYINYYLRSILRNLLGNALKYRAADRPLRVQVQASRVNGFAVLSVQDNGPGIDLARSGHKLFQPFSRLNAAGNGKGLGLYLIRNIVQRNGGRIEAASPAEGGVCFTCYLREYDEG